MERAAGPRVTASVLSQLPEVRDVAVVRVRTTGRPLLVAHVAAAPGVDGEQLRRAVATVLPAGMVPRRVVVHDELPRGPGGEVDHDRLEPPVRAADEVPGIAGAIARTWSADLGLGVGPHDDFFTLGGDLALAERTMVRLEQLTGEVTAASALLTAGSPAQLARTAESGSPDSTVVPLQPGTEGRAPVVVTYDMDGSALTMRELAHALGPDQPALGIDSPLLRGVPCPPDLEGIVARHHDDLVQVQPNGPYRIIGFSLGAFIAYELAHQLLRSGREVAFLGLIDLGPVHVRYNMGRRRGIRPAATYPWRPPKDQPLPRRLAGYSRHLAALDAAERMAYVARVAHLGRDFDLARCRSDLRRTGSVRPGLRPVWSWFNLMELTVAYRPRPYPGPATLFVSDQTLRGNIPTHPKIDYASKTEPTLGWGPLLGERLNVWPVVGWHNDLNEWPHVGRLGREVRAGLDGATGPTIGDPGRLG